MPGVSPVASMNLGPDGLGHIIAQTQSGNAAAHVTPNVPSSLKVVNATPLPDPNIGPGCARGFYGLLIDIDYQVMDGEKQPQPLKDPTMTPHEYIVFDDGTTRDKDIGPVPGYSTSSRTARADGTFDDVPVGPCKFIPFNTPIPASQDISILWHKKSYPVRHNDWKWSSTNFPNGHGTDTNGNDVNVTQ